MLFSIPLLMFHKQNEIPSVGRMQIHAVVSCFSFRSPAKIKIPRILAAAAVFSWGGVKQQTKIRCHT